ncbi:MAG: hypothetical protein OXL36_17265 [Bryobacterales bacterium]|nr:hypothetical protein [Bryobacterales bacterium]MDE0296031.1 hypothetical protein [Bryobacterales bacterium]
MATYEIQSLWDLFMRMLGLISSFAAGYIDFPLVHDLNCLLALLEKAGGTPLLDYPICTCNCSAEHTKLVRWRVR